MKWKLAIIDDHPLVREGIAEVFATETDFEIVGEAASADQAIGLASLVEPDLIFLDINMPGGGVAAASRIRQLVPEVRILMFSFRQDPEVVRTCMLAGASGYVVKGVSGPELILIARKIMSGSTHFDPTVQRVPAHPINAAEPEA